MKRLIDPSDDALNEAFAVEVAGWKDEAIEITGFGVFYGQVEVPRFTHSVDAVLPCLEKSNYFPIIRRPYGNPVLGGRTWEIELCGPLGGLMFRSYAETFPKALVLALLRSKGVEIEFTKSL